MSLHYTVLLDNEFYTYYGGQTVTGRVEILLNKPEKIRGILFRIDGRSQVRWTQGRETFFAEEQYFKSKHYYVGGKDHNPIIIEPGSYSYPFSYILPTTLPSSFEGRHGYIRYTAKVILERPHKFNLENKVVFTVISPYNLTQFPNLLSPGEVITEKYLCCWCCKQGPITSIITVPKTGYVSGETIPVTIELDNLSDEDIYEITLQLQQCIEYHCQHKSIIETRVVERFKLGTLGRRNSKTTTQAVLIPSLPPTNINECSIIDSRYELMLEAVTGTLHTNFRSKLTITIGTVPTFEQMIPNIDSLQPATSSYETTMCNYPETSQETLKNNSHFSAPTFSDNKMFSMESSNDHDSANGQ